MCSYPTTHPLATNSQLSGHCPRIIHVIGYMVLLVSAIYECPNGHELLATDPRLLQCLPEQEYVPFILFHRSGVMRSFARTVITLTVEVLSICAIERFIISQRTDHITSLQLKLNCILSQIQNLKFSSIKNDESIAHIHKRITSFIIALYTILLKASTCTFKR